MSKVVALVLERGEYENYGEYANLPVYNAHGNIVGWTGGELPESGYVCEHAVLDEEGFLACHSSSEVVKLRDDNAKLRELVADMWHELDAATQYDAGGGRGIVYEFADRMRELGVEVGV